MFGRKKSRVVREPALPSVPDSEAIEHDLALAPGDDLVFLTQVPEATSNLAASIVDEVTFKRRFQKKSPPNTDTDQEESQGEGDQEGGDGEKVDNLYDKVILHNLNCERAKSLRAKLGIEVAELQDTREKFDSQVETLEAEVKEAQDKLSEVRSIKAFTRPSKTF